MINLLEQSYKNFGDIIGDECTIIDDFIDDYKDTDIRIYDLMKERANDLVYGRDLTKIISKINPYVENGIKNNVFNMNNVKDVYDLLEAGAYLYVYRVLSSNSDSIVFNFVSRYLGEHYSEEMEKLNMDFNDLMEELGFSAISHSSWCLSFKCFKNRVDCHMKRLIQYKLH